MLGLRLLGTTGQRGPRKSLKEFVVGKKRGPMPFMNPREPPIPQKVIEHGWFPLIWVSELFAQTGFTAAERPRARANHSQIPTHEKPIWPTRSTLAYPDAIHWAFQHHCGIR